MRTSPGMPTHQPNTMPLSIIDMPTPLTAGHIELGGMWMGPRTWDVVRASSAPSLAHSGSSPCTVGMVPKLCGGGGELIDHSSVEPPQGLGPDTAPPRALARKFQMNTSSESAIPKTPTVEIRLKVSNPMFGA